MSEFVKLNNTDIAKKHRPRNKHSSGARSPVPSSLILPSSDQNFLPKQSFSIHQSIYLSTQSTGVPNFVCLVWKQMIPQSDFKNLERPLTTFLNTNVINPSLSSVKQRPAVPLPLLVLVYS